jgi:hypothetical protein
MTVTTGSDTIGLPRRFGGRNSNGISRRQGTSFSFSLSALITPASDELITDDNVVNRERELLVQAQCLLLLYRTRFIKSTWMGEERSVVAPRVAHEFWP